LKFAIILLAFSATFYGWLSSKFLVIYDVLRIVACLLITMLPGIFCFTSDYPPSLAFPLIFW